MSLLTHLHWCVRSTQIQTFLFGFGATTIPEHQFVGPSTLETICWFSILVSSAFTWFISGSGICLGVNRVNRVASLLSLMSYSCWSCPSPENNWGNFVITISSLMVMSQTFATRFSAFNAWEADQWYVKSLLFLPFFFHSFTLEYL